MSRRSPPLVCTRCGAAVSGAGAALLGVFSAFSIGRMQLPYVAMAALAGGNVRVGLEDNLYHGPGEHATNGQLVQRAVTILEAMNVRVARPTEVRERLKLSR